MKHRFYFYLCLLEGLHLVHNVDLDTPISGSTKTPRLQMGGLTSGEYVHKVPQNHSVFSYQEDELYVGGTDFVLKLDVNDYHVLEKFTLNATEQHCHDGPCANVITVIEKFQDSVFVCGTNGLKPQCWKLFPSVSDQSHEIVESYEGTGISPFVYTQNSLSLTVDEDLYAAAPLDADGSTLQFRRKAGSRTNVWMHDSWVSEPTFISASWVKRVNDPNNEKIYIFFREKNSDHSPEADPWISRVARVCKVDEGGPKRYFQNTWTSFLKARLVCGFPDESLYFSHLQDIFVMHAEDWHETKIYALFSSSWNSTAVCIYSIGMIEEIFENSTFRGYNKEIPHPRPGTCVPNSKSLPLDTMSVVRDHPEMTDWVHSLHHKAPFYISNNNYTKIAVDQVQAADGKMYNILLLATDSGKIHKVLEAGSEPFIISETQLSSNSSIQAMKLHSKKRKLVVGFSEKISTVDLRRCDEYGDSCAECVLARDPYCAWTAAGCTQTVPSYQTGYQSSQEARWSFTAPLIILSKNTLEKLLCFVHRGSIQNIMDGKINVCPTSTGEYDLLRRFKRQTYTQKDPETVHSVPQGVPFYLTCPIDSYHASYVWEHKSDRLPCLQMLSNCLHLIPSMTRENYGNYSCVSKEKDYTKIVKSYQLMEQILPEDGKDFKRSFDDVFMNNASGLSKHTSCVEQNGSQEPFTAKTICK